MTTLSRSGPAYYVQTERLVLRCWHPADAPLLQAAISDSLDHLRPWMPWVRDEPEDLQVKVERLRSFRARFDLDQDFIYAIFDREETAVLGGTGLHTRIGKDALEIGYWIHAHYVNQGLATEAAAALTRVAFEVNNVNRVEIHCNPVNGRSAAIPTKLGFTHEATLRQRLKEPDGAYRDAMVWTLFREDYPQSPAASAVLQAFDVMGRRLL